VLFHQSLCCHLAQFHSGLIEYPPLCQFVIPSLQLCLEHNQESPDMTGFLDLPYELRYMVYDNLLEMRWIMDDRIFWVPGVDIIMHPAMAISRRKGEDFRPTGGPYIFRKRGTVTRGREYPTVSLYNITPLVCLARTSKILYKEVVKLAWSNSNLKVQGSLNMVCGLLGPRLALCMSPLVKNCIEYLELGIFDPSYQENLQTMKEIVGLINTHLPALRRLDLSFPHLTDVHRDPLHLLGKSAKAAFAQLLLLRLELRVAFHVYQRCKKPLASYCHCNIYHAHRDLAGLLTDIHTSNRTKALDRQRKKQEHELLDLDHCLLRSVDLRSVAHHGGVSCSSNHMVWNNLAKIPQDHLENDLHDLRECGGRQGVA